MEKNVSDICLSYMQVGESVRTDIVEATHISQLGNCVKSLA